MNIYICIYTYHSKIAKISPKSKEKFAYTTCLIFLVAVVIEIFSSYDTYLDIYKLMNI